MSANNHTETFREIITAAIKAEVAKALKEAMDEGFTKKQEEAIRALVRADLVQQLQSGRTLKKTVKTKATTKKTGNTKKTATMTTKVPTGVITGRQNRNYSMTPTAIAQRERRDAKRREAEQRAALSNASTEKVIDEVGDIVSAAVKNGSGTLKATDPFNGEMTGLSV